MTRTVQVTKRIPRLTADVWHLASDYLWRGLDPQEAWNEFVKDRALRPEMDAKEFWQIYDRADPYPIDRVFSMGFTPTHFDKLYERECQITHQAATGVYELLWDDGSTGGNPPCLPPDPDRFIPLEEHNV